MAHEREQVDSRMAKVDVQELGIAATQDTFELIVLSAIENGFQALDVFPLKAQQKVNPWARKNLDVGEWEYLSVLSRLGHDEGSKFAQSCDLPVDVPHLALKKGIAVTGDDGLMHEALQQIAARSVRQADFLSNPSSFVV